MVGDEGRFRKPRVTLERKNNLVLYSWQSGEGGGDSGEMSPLYENRCLAVVAPITGRMLAARSAVEEPGRG
jgi:hypothetical protein